MSNKKNLSGECPTSELEPDYNCKDCWDKGCSSCNVRHPETGVLIPVTQFDQEIYEQEELCSECYDPDCIIFSV